MMTNIKAKLVFTFLCLFSCPLLSGQRADSLRSVQKIYLGSLGTLEGAEELKQELAAAIRHDHTLLLAQDPQQADIVLEGRGELWVRSYHSLGTRSRANSLSAEPSYAGYLSVKALGSDGNVLWSYLASPGRISLGGIKHQLANQVVTKLLDEIEKANQSAPPPAVPRSPVSAANPPLTLNGSGATFPFPLYQDWFRSFHAKHQPWTFAYQPVGSEAGIEQLVAGTVDFAGSDIPPSASAALKATHGLRAFPSVGGAVVLVYNLPHAADELRLTPDLLAGIFNGTITRWNDPALRAINPHRSLPNAAIIPVHRADGSGTTFALTEYLSQTNESWKQQIGIGPRVKWPAGQEATGNEEVAQFVSKTPYSIGYVEFIFAFYHHVSIASIQNAAGDFIQPDLPSITAAANSWVGNDASITNSTAPGAYPIATFSWLLFKDSLDPAKHAAMTTFVDWMFSSGQKECSALGYAPLPPTLLKHEIEAQQEK